MKPVRLKAVADKAALAVFTCGGDPPGRIASDRANFGISDQTANLAEQSPAGTAHGAQRIGIGRRYRPRLTRQHTDQAAGFRTIAGGASRFPGTDSAGCEGLAHSAPSIADQAADPGNL